MAATNQAFQQRSPSSKVQILREASGLFDKGGKDAAFFKMMTDEEVDLMEVQRSMETSCPVPGVRLTLLGLGLIQTIEQLLYVGIDSGNSSTSGGWVEQEVAKIVKRFRVSEKSLWYTKIRCYSERGDWDQLLRLAQEKKSPVGYKPFARACIE